MKEALLLYKTESYQRIRKEFLANRETYLTYDNVPCGDDILTCFSIIDFQLKYVIINPWLFDKAKELIKKEETNSMILELWKDIQIKRQVIEDYPPDKAIFRKTYLNDWAIGDCFAYYMTEDEAKLHEMRDKYIILRKVGEYRWYPKSQIPIINVFNWIGEEPVDNVDSLLDLRIIPLSIRCRPFDF